MTRDEGYLLNNQQTALLVERGAELALVRTLPRLVREAGLMDVQADGFVPVHRACVYGAGGGDRPAGPRTHGRGPDCYRLRG